jgi:vacuolar-type H+-ATPase subunit I/STV1
MRERAHVSLVTCSDYIEHISRALKSIESSIARLQGQLQEVQQLISLLSDLESVKSSTEEIKNEATVSAIVTESTSPPQLLVAQPIQQVVRLSNRKQLVLAHQRARDWAAHELNHSRWTQSS